MKAAKQPIDRGAPASVIAAKFGGLSKLADAINRKPSTVHRWLVNGYIPNPYHDETNEAAERLGIAIEPVDYVDTRTAEQRAADSEAIAA